MAGEPTIEIDTRAYNAGTGVYNVAIINAGVVDGTLRWSDNGVSGNITRPSSNDKWSQEFWHDSTADTKIADSTDTPDAASQPEAFLKVYSGTVNPGRNFDTAPKFTVYDDTSHSSQGEQACIGTTNHTSPFVKGSIGTSYNPVTQWTTPQYWDEASSAALHNLEVAGSQNVNGNNALCGTTNWLVASTTNIELTPQYIWLALSVPDDASTGIDVINVVLTMEYSYT